jgi:hypothetical protein
MPRSVGARVTRWVCEKNAQTIGQPIFCQNFTVLLFYCGKKYQVHMYENLKNLPKENNCPIGENSPNLVTLVVVSSWLFPELTISNFKKCWCVFSAGWPDWANFRGVVFFNCSCSSHFLATFLHASSFVLILIKNGLGYVSGDFFTKSSGTDVTI